MVPSMKDSDVHERAGLPGEASPPLLSVVVPMYNEESMIEAFFAELCPCLQRISSDWEMICINDGSRDRTLELLLRQSEADSRIKVLDLSRNFGKEAALSAGLEWSTGRAVVPIDVDLQDPPELLGPMLEKWREGYEVVHARRVTRRSDSPGKRMSARTFYRLYNRLSKVVIPPDVGDFRLMDRAVVDVIAALPERNRFMKGLFAWAGFRSTAVDYERAPRRHGVSKWNYWTLWNFALEGITSFSTVPLRIWTYAGGLVAVITALYALLMVTRTLLFGADVPGYTSLIVAVLFLGSVQLVSLGILGEYIGRIYLEVKRRPVYIVRQHHGFAARPRPGPSA